MRASPWIVVLGPTASGKTRLAAELASRFNGEVVSADSMQVYRGLSIGTAKPAQEEKRGIAHHMIDILDIDQAFSVAQYRQRALECIDGIRARAHIPVIAGGTGMYIDSLTHDMDYGGSGQDAAIREALMKRAEIHGGEALWEELYRVDPLSAQRIHKNDIHRLVRALEVFQSTGLPFSLVNKRVPLPQEEQPLYIGLTMERGKLYERINLRVDEMVAAGLVEEANRFYLIHKKSRTAVQALGYKELFDAFGGLCSLDQAIERIKRESRRYAKRQMTYFRRNERIHWFDALDEALLDKVSQRVYIYLNDENICT